MDSWSRIRPNFKAFDLIKNATAATTGQPVKIHEEFIYKAGPIPLQIISSGWSGTLTFYGTLASYSAIDAGTAQYTAIRDGVFTSETLTAMLSRCTAIKVVAAVSAGTVSARILG